jgi:meso-butanediol dehydrogenase / (S,S)-butanediol dehydrogenase / diacetyl reductase
MVHQTKLGILMDPKRVVVVGCVSGIGRAIVDVLRARECVVAALDIDSAVESLEAEYTGVVDISDYAGMDVAIEGAASALGGIEGLVTVAGLIRRGTIDETDVEDWDRQFQVNARGPYIASKLVLPHLRRAGGGSIVLVSSQVGIVGAPACVAYGSSKAAVVQLARCLAIDHSREGVRVNALCPGITEGTGVFKDSVDYYEAGAARDRELARMRDASLQGRLLSVSEVAECASFLVSSASTGMTGSALVVDGGYTAQ